MARLIGGVLSRRAPARLDRTRSDLVVVVSGFDDAEACSTALERGIEDDPVWVVDADAVLRHHLRLPADAVRGVLDIAAQDGYAPTSAPESVADGVVVLRLERVQVLDALHCSQERSRMVGLAQRHGGTALGWEGLQPHAAP
ncbi:ribonuclease E inhibitor RraB [Rhodococcus xishaensis]|nr:ribonuclease E inhibitor RraB [Rhodococcus xishaensis]